MTRLWADSFDAGEWATRYTRDTWANPLTYPGRSGSGLSVGNNTFQVTANSAWRLDWEYDGSETTLVAGCDVFVSPVTALTTWVPMAVVNNGAAPLNPCLYLKIDRTNYRVIVARGSNYFTQTVLGTSADNSLTTDTWAHVEWKFKIASAANGGFVVVRIDGVEVINVTGVDTTNGGAANIDRIALSGSGDASSTDTENQASIVDNFYVLDTTGASDNDFLGPGDVTDYFGPGPGEVLLDPEPIDTTVGITASLVVESAPGEVVLDLEAIESTVSISASLVNGKVVELLLDQVYGAVLIDMDLTGGTGLMPEPVEADVDIDLTLDVIPAPSLPPVAPVWWYRTSETYPDPTSMLLAYDRPDPATFVPSSAVVESIGRPYVRIGGKDLTYWRGVPVEVVSWSESEPFGWEVAVVRWPHGSLLTTTTDDPVKKGVAFNLGMADTTNKHAHWLFRGFVADITRTEDAVQVTAAGNLRQTVYAMHQPPFFASLIDMGHDIANDLNKVVSRRYGKTARVTTGIKHARRGTRSDTVYNYIVGLLNLMTTDDGMQQWTVMPTESNVPKIRYKDRTTQHWTVTAGQRGVDITMRDDLLEDENVIYGSGISENREKWDNARWPGSDSNTAPPYPNNNPGNTIRQGETDRSTDNGRGVTQIQKRLKELGFGGVVNGVYSADTATRVRRFQKSVKIQVDGVVAGQTWNALWPVKGLLGDPLFLPLAARDDVMPVDYKADGDVAGPNPDYDPRAFRVERYYSFGEGVSRSEAQRWAQSIIERNQTIPNLTGTVTLTGDPQEGSRRLIKAGQNIRIKGYAGVTAGVLMHIVRVQQVNGGEQTTLTVDSRARDALELGAIVARNRDAVDPARRILQARESLNDRDLSPWHSEPPAGIIPELPLFSNLWSVVGIPVGAYGTVVRSLMQTSPAAAYAAVVFSKKVSAQWLLNVVGNPLAEHANGFGKIANAEDVLTKNGMLIAWGQSGQAMGYWPGETSPTGGKGKLTGRFDEVSSWEFASYSRTLIWLAVYANRSTFLTGRFFVDLPWDG